MYSSISLLLVIIVVTITVAWVLLASRRSDFSSGAVRSPKGAQRRRKRILHLSFHIGCIQEVKYMGDRFGFDVDTDFIPNLSPEMFDGQPPSNARYNMTKKRAQAVWKLQKDRYMSYDTIVVSDTAPLCRIFLEANYTKPLIVWVCNRFDYADTSALQSGEQFPDKGYYKIIDSIKHLSNVSILSYTPWEHVYAQHVARVGHWSDVLRPVGARSFTKPPKSIPRPQGDVFLPPYNNDKLCFSDIKTAVEDSDLTVFQGRYSTPFDLTKYKCIDHIPYAMSNLALFENIQLGIVYFIPSAKFISKSIAARKGFFMQTDPTTGALPLSSSEWYCEYMQPAFVTFDSWKDLTFKLNTVDLKKKQKSVRKIADDIMKSSVAKWKSLILT